MLTSSKETPTYDPGIHWGRENQLLFVLEGVVVPQRVPIQEEAVRC